MKFASSTLASAAARAASPLAQPASPSPALASPPASKVSKVYQHWADGDMAMGSNAEWNNNILSANKSDYFEGEVVPNMFYYQASNKTPLVQGQSYSFNVTYNHYQGNTNAGGYAYMTTYNLDRSPGTLTGATPTVDTVAPANNGGGMQGDFYTVNANVTDVSDVTYVEKGGSIDAQVTITFTYTGATTSSGGAEIYFGLMVASPGMVSIPGMEPTLGAHAWTGGSLQTTVDIGGSGATSIQLAPSAILAGEIAGMKFEDINGDGERDADGVDNVAGNADDEAGLSGWTIFLDTNNNGSLDTGERSTVTDAGGLYVFSVTPDADPSDPDNDAYVVREVMQMGWVRTTTNPSPITIDAQHPTKEDVDFGNQRYLPALDIQKEASVPGGTADVAGEVIRYTIAVHNTGNQTLTGVTVTDPFISDLLLVVDSASSDSELDVGETWQYTASHEVTQAEIDNGGPIVNTATADSDQTGQDTDDASVPVAQRPAMEIVKEATVPGGTADTVGELISYTVTLTNTGNQTLTGVSASDPSVSNLTLVSDAATADGELDVDESWTYVATRAVTQADIDAGGSILNIATGDSDQTPPVDDDASVPVAQRPVMEIVKEATVPGGTADVAGELVSYTVVITNSGNQTLTEVSVTDPFISNLALVPSDATTDGELDIDESWTYIGTHAVTQAEIDAGDNIVNIATGDSRQTAPVTDDASVPVEQRPALAIDKAVLGVEGGNGNTTADFAGDVIRYSILVYNPGNQTLTGVTVVDPVTGLDIDSLTLAPGGSQAYETSYTLTQQDMDTYGGGDGEIENTATADSDQTGSVSASKVVPLQVRPSLSINKVLARVDSGNGNGIADVAGDRLHYTIEVVNEGTVTLTGLRVTDDLTGLNTNGRTLAPGERASFETFYTLTQEDLDNNGGGDGYIDNIATADTDQTAAVTDAETVPLVRTVSLGINKSLVNVTGGNANGFADVPGDQINFTIRVYNPGSVTLTGLTLVDPQTGLSTTLASLAPGASQTFPTSYTLTQADIDANVDGYIDNLAIVDSLQTDAVSDTESVMLVRYPVLAFDKGYTGVSPTSGNGNALADAPGDVLNYRFTVVNAGNLTQTNVSISDPLTGFLVEGVTLDPGQLRTWTSTYTLTQADIDDNGDGDGDIDNTATVDSDQSAPLTDSESVPIERSIALAFDEAFVEVTGGNGNTLADAAGDVLHFRFVATNAGTVTLTNVRVTDALTSLDATVASLAPGASQEFTGTYVLQQSDLDGNGGGDGRLDNVSFVTSDQSGPGSDAESVTLVYDPQVDLTKYVSVDNGVTWVDANLPPGPELDSATGFNPLFRFVVTNAGNVTLPGVEITDSVYDLNGPSTPGGSHLFGPIAVGDSAEWIFTGATFGLGLQTDDATAVVVGMPTITDVDNVYYTGV